jgi:hypothetical protein
MRNYCNTRACNLFGTFAGYFSGAQSQADDPDSDIDMGDVPSAAASNQYP